MGSISDDFVDSTIANLKVIGMVPRNGRLCVRKGQLCLETPDHMQSVRRWARGDSRDLCLMHVRNTMYNAQRIIQHLSTGVSSDRSNWVLQQIVAELGQCEVGLQNLRTTYATDSMMVANVGVLIERISSYRAAVLSERTESRAPAKTQSSGESKQDVAKAKQVVQSNLER